MRALTEMEARMLDGATAGFDRDRPNGVQALTRIIADDLGTGGYGEVDLTRYLADGVGNLPVDLVDSWSISGDIDTPVTSASVDIRTVLDHRGVLFGLPFLAPGRSARVRFEVALAPADYQRQDANLLPLDIQRGSAVSGSAYAWEALVGATVASSAVKPLDGARSLLVTCAAGAGSGARVLASGLVPGGRYLFSVWLRAAAAGAARILAGSASAAATVGPAWSRHVVEGVADVDGTLYLAADNGAGGALAIWADRWRLEVNDGIKWRNIFEGYVDRISSDWKQHTTTLELRDRCAEVQDVFIEAERPYGAALGEPVEDILERLIEDNSGPTWTAAATVAAGDLVRPTVANGLCFACSTAGITGGAEPDWPLRLGATVADGTATWRCCQAVPDVYVPAAPAPAWMIRPYQQQRMPVLEAQNTLARMIAWDVRQRWDDTEERWRLTFADADRSKVAADYVLGSTRAHLVRDISGFSRSIDTVRNVVRVVYSVSTGTGQRTHYDAIDQASVGAYGRRYCEIAEASTSQINTATEAQTLAEGALSDLSQVLSECSMTLEPWPWVELGDIIDTTALFSGGESIGRDIEQFTAWGAKFSVLGYQHEGGPDGMVTKLSLRETRVTGAMRAWLEREVRPGVAPSAPLLADQMHASTRAYLAVAQSIPSGVATAVAFDTVGVDGTRTFDISVGDWTVPVSGRYSIEAQVTMLLMGAGEVVRISLLSGATVIAQEQWSSVTGGTVAARVSIVDRQFQSLEPISVRVEHSDAAARDASAGADATWATFSRTR